VDNGAAKKDGEKESEEEITEELKITGSCEINVTLGEALPVEDGDSLPALFILNGARVVKLRFWVDSWNQWVTLAPTTKPEGLLCDLNVQE
jgi:hypothetical protein